MKERILRALGILFAVALIAGGILTAVIAEEAPTVSIEYFTLSHENAVYIEYAVDYRGFDGVPENTGMLYWTKEPVKPELGTEDSRSGMLGYDKINGQKYYIFKYANLTAAQMCDDIWACAYATVDGTTYYSNVEKYSVETYAARKLGLVPGVEGTKDETLKDLLRAMLEYGEKAQKHFKDARQDIYPTDILHPVTVTFDADNGTTPTAQTVWRNRKPAKPADPTKDGYTFAGWWNGNTEWNFDTDTVTEDVTLTAHWNVAIRYSEGLSFALNEDGTCSVTGIGTCTDTELNIPPVALDNKRVTRISDDAFQSCRNLTSVTIPDGVTYIDGFAFYGCKNLTSVTIPDGVTHIGSYAFYGCKSLTNITLPEGLSFIGDYAFGVCSISSIRIPAGVTFIGTNPFIGCSSLASIEVADGNKTFHAAGNCLIETDTKTLLSGLKNSIIPADGSVTSIAGGAFGGCSDLSDLAIPSTVTSIGDAAFSGCSSLTSIVIPEGVTSIGDYAFSGCRGLTSIVIPEGLSFIGDYAFSECSISSIRIPAGVTFIGTNPFIGCSSLASIEVADGNKTFHAAGNCLIETDTKTLLSGLKNSRIPADGSVTSIADEAFAYCSDLSDLAIPSTVTRIGENAFFGCDKLIQKENSISYVGKWVVGCADSATSVTLRDDTIGIAEKAFYDCRYLTQVTIPSGVTYIGKGAFLECENLNYIELPFVGSTPNGTVNTHFGYIFGAGSNTDNAYYVPKSLTKVSFRGTAKDFTIDKNAFYGLTWVTVVQEFRVEYNYGDGFGNRIQYVSKGSFAPKPTDATKDGYRLVGWFHGDREWNFDTDIVTEDVTLTARWTEIPTSKGLKYTSNGDGTCYLSGIGSCEDSDLNIPSKSPAGDCVTGIGNWAFDQCRQLTSVIIPDSMTTIGERAFNGCSNLTYIVIPNSVTSIGVYAFAYCNLEEIAFPDSVTQIGDDILNSCNNLKRITVDPNNPIYRAAGNCLIDRRNGVLLVGCQNSVIPTDGSVKSIYVFAFYKCEGLKSIVIPKGVTSIGYEAFYYCSNLTSVTISDSVTSFAFEAFRGCSNLTTINYEGTMEQWNSIEKADSWDKFIDSYTVHCTDGDIVKS